MANSKGKALFGILENMTIRQSRQGSEYVRATLVSKRLDGTVAFKTDIIAFTPKKADAKDPVAALKALGNDANVRVYGFMEDVDQNGKYTKQMLRVVDARDNVKKDETAQAGEDTAAESTETKEAEVEVPF